jgi:NAD(P)-dependent dehydrogenase (short-subunit alcohol dehydrogenase family)
MGALNGKVCIITGGAGSVGAATARLFLAEGASVMLVDLKADDLGRVAATLDNPRVAVYAADVTRADNVAGYVAATLKLFGKIDVLLSNAGTFGVVSIVITSSVAATRSDPGVYAYITAKHAQVGLMRCLAKELAPRGIRVNTIHPGPIDNDFQLNVEDGLSQAIGRNGTDFFNEIVPMHRHASADEIARSVLYLASDQSSFTTGAMLMVDGGMSA